MIGNSWDEILKDEYNKDYFIKLKEFILNEYKTKIIYPKITDIFNALKYTDYKDVKVVLIGQDPYHDENQAEGLAFSVKEGIKKPPSLVNIFKELNSDLGIDIPSSGSLVKWTKEGVLLLNTVLTVEKDKAGSHRNMGWEKFTDSIIKKINEKNSPVVFILWGRDARNKKALITNNKHFIIESVHPSPLSVYNGFFGSKPFSKTNNYLIKTGQEPINWNLN